MAIEVYWNSRSKVFSIRDQKTKKVIDRKKCVTLRNGYFSVSASGRARVLANKTKNVHAYVRGTEALLPHNRELVGEVSYDPYINTWFQLYNYETRTSSQIVVGTYVKMLAVNGHPKIYVYKASGTLAKPMLLGKHV